MKHRINILVDYQNWRDFVKLNGKGGLSRFVDEKISEYLEKMRLRWWIVCPECKQKVHIRIVLNNGGHCDKNNCKGVIAEKINGVS